jgi:hypothetical protein
MASDWKTYFDLKLSLMCVIKTCFNFGAPIVLRTFQSWDNITNECIKAYATVT